MHIGALRSSLMKPEDLNIHSADCVHTWSYGIIVLVLSMFPGINLVISKFDLTIVVPFKAFGICQWIYYKFF